MIYSDHVCGRQKLVCARQPKMSGGLSSLHSSHAACAGLTRNLVIQLRPGLLLSAIEGIDTEGEDAVAEMRPGIALSLMLTGHAEARCGKSNYPSDRSVEAPLAA